MPTQFAIANSTSVTTVAQPDHVLTAAQLDDKYNPKGHGEHPLYARSEWRDAVFNEDTITGYWVWVASELESAHMHSEALVDLGNIGDLNDSDGFETAIHTA